MQIPNELILFDYWILYRQYDIWINFHKTLIVHKKKGKKSGNYPSMSNSPIQQIVHTIPYGSITCWMLLIKHYYAQHVLDTGFLPLTSVALFCE